MASVTNTSTLVILRSVNTPDYPAPWVVTTEANANAWSLIPQKYRKWVTDHVEEMTQPEKDAVDAAAIGVSRDTTADRMNDVEDIIRAYALVALDDRNDSLAATINELLTAIDNATTLAGLKSAVALIADVPERTGAQLRNQVRAKLGS